MDAQESAKRVSSAGRLGTIPLSVLLALCAGCVQHAGPEAMALLDQGRAAFDKSDNQTAIAKESEFLTSNAKTAEADAAHYVRGLAYWRTGNIPAALEDLTIATRRSRTRAMHYRSLKALGDLTLQTGDAQRARTVYTQALEEADPNAPAVDEVRYGLGCALQRLGEWWDADGQFDRLLHDFPDAATAKLAERRIRCKAWTLLVKACAREGLANAESARLAKIGLATTVGEAVVDGRLQFLVQAGRHNTYAEAEKQAADVRRFAADARIVPTR